MAKTSLIARAMRGARVESPAFSLPNNAKQAVLSIPVTGFPDTGAEVLKINLYVSADSGQTWTFAGGFGVRGGSRNHWSGAPVTETCIGIPVPKNRNPQERWKIELVPSLSLDLQASMESQ